MRFIQSFIVKQPVWAFILFIAIIVLILKFQIDHPKTDAIIYKIIMIGIVLFFIVSLIGNITGLWDLSI